MDAALRSAYFLVTGKNPDPDAFTAVRGMDGWKEATFNIPGAGDVRVAVVSSLGKARKLIEAVKRGDAAYDFVEVMACPGGCVAGAGTMQPIKKSQAAVNLYASKAKHKTSNETEHVKELDKLVD